MKLLNIENIEVKIAVAGVFIALAAIIFIVKFKMKKNELIRKDVQQRLNEYQGRFARFLFRNKFPNNQNKVNLMLSDVITSIVSQIEKSKALGFKSSPVIFNLLLYFLIADRDIQAVKNDALGHPDAWKRKLSARIILLIIHELDLDKAAGNKFRNALDEAGISDSVKVQVTLALREARGAQTKAQRIFNYHRNNTIAHRNQDGLEQYHSIMAIDEIEVIKIAAEFYNATARFRSVLPELMIQSGSTKGLINQIKAQSRVKK